jgi:hypothetical protein
LDTGSKLNEAIAALTELSTMNHTSNKSSVTVPQKVPGQRTTTKEPVQKRNMTPKMIVDPRLAHHRGTRGLSSTVSLDSFNSTNNDKKGTISSKNKNNNPNINDNNSIDTQQKENSPQNAPIRSPITEPNSNDINVNIIDTKTEDAPILRWTLRTRTKPIKQAHKINTTVYRIFCDDGLYMWL